MVVVEFEAEVQSETMATELKRADTAANLTQKMTSMQIIINICCFSPSLGIVSAIPARFSSLLLVFLRLLIPHDCLPRFFTVSAA